MQSERDPLRKIPTKHAPEPKADIGSTLRAAREKRGQTLEAVSQQTRISRRYLEALEKNRFDEFPALAYLRGFLKSYCDYLEVEFEPLWRIATTEEAKEPAPAPGGGPVTAPAASPAPAAAAVQHAPAKASAPAPKAKAHAPSPAHKPAAAHPAERHDGAVLAVFALCALTIGSAIWLVRRPRSAGRDQPALPAALAPLAVHPQSRVAFTFRDDAWISVSADGKPVFEGRVPKASRQEWPAAKSLSFKTVTPDAIQLTVNGAPLKMPRPDANGVYRIETP